MTSNQLRTGRLCLPAGMVEGFEIDVSPLLQDQSAAGGDSEWRADEFLAHLQPGALRALSIQCEPSVPGSLVRAAERFTRLTALREPAPAATPAVLRRLPLLQHFQLRSEQLPKGIMPALLAMQQLTGLELKGRSPDGGDFRSLQQLSSLGSLALHDVCGDDDFAAVQYLAPTPAAFPFLTTYAFSETVGLVQVSVQPAHLMSGRLVAIRVCVYPQWPLDASVSQAA